MCKQAWGYDTSKSGTETRDRGYLPGSHIFAVISPLPPNVQGFRLLPEGIWVEWKKPGAEIKVFEEKDGNQERISEMDLQSIISAGSMKGLTVILE